MRSIRIIPMVCCRLAWLQREHPQCALLPVFQHMARFVAQNKAGREGDDFDVVEQWRWDSDGDIKFVQRCFWGAI